MSFENESILSSFIKEQITNLPMQYKMIQPPAEPSTTAQLLRASGLEEPDKAMRLNGNNLEGEE